MKYNKIIFFCKNGIFTSKIFLHQIYCYFSLFFIFSTFIKKYTNVLFILLFYQTVVKNDTKNLFFSSMVKFTFFCSTRVCILFIIIVHEKNSFRNNITHEFLMKIS